MRPLLASLALAALSLSVPFARSEEPAIGFDPEFPWGLRYYYPVERSDPAEVIEADLCIYGGTPGGVMAAVQAARMNKTAVLAVFRRHVGGMTSGGLTETDLGRRDSIGGLARDFYNRLGSWSGFRPSAAERLYRTMLEEAGVRVLYEHRLDEVVVEGKRIREVRFENGNRVRAKMFIDATYEGDLLAGAGVSFTVGREPNALYGETYNGVRIPGRGGHDFRFPVDPYRVEGDPESGLVWGVSPDPPAEPGSGDHKVQAYCFRMWLRKAPNVLPFPKPEGYDRDRYELLRRYLLKPEDPSFWNLRYSHGPVKLNEGDCNNAGPFSLDYLMGNWDWPEAGYEAREAIFQDHVNYQQGMMWFLANDPEVPASLRERVRQFGLPRDEFVETGGWPHELYVREGRRMVSDYVMTDHDCLGRRAAEDSVGLASYGMDSHHVERVVVDGVVLAEGNCEVGVPAPYPVSYRSIVPRREECENLLVPVSLSASHIAFGSIRMEPVYMILGQSAATAAAMAIDGRLAVQDVDYARLRERLEEDGQVLEWTGPRAAVPPAARRIAPAELRGVVVDDAAAKLTGSWETSAFVGPFVGEGYRHDRAAGGGAAARFEARLPQPGMYAVRVLYPPHENRAPRVPVTVHTADGKAAATIDQRTADAGEPPGRTLGPYRFDREAVVEISNEGCRGFVVIDAVQLLRQEPSP